MELVIVVVIVGAVIWLIDRARKRRRQTAPAAASPVRQAAQHLLPTFKVVALGVPGSGKTALLASMFYRQWAPRPELGNYYLRLPHSDAYYLSSLYREISDPTGLWPSGTGVGQEREFEFGCMLQLDGAHHELARIKYIDYAGELLTEASPEHLSSFEVLLRHVEEASVMLVIIDGLRLRQYFDGHVNAAFRLDLAIRPYIQLALRATCPVQFLITKWDLLQPIGFDDRERLRKCRDALLSNEAFRALVLTHNRDRMLRLIPVSAVGYGFADLAPGGHVVKRADAEASPTYVEIPLCAVVPDLFQQVEHALDEAARTQVMGELQRLMGRGGGWANLAAPGMAQTPARRLLRSLAGTVPNGGLAAESVELLAEWLARPFLQEREDAFRQVDAFAAQRATILRARSALLEIMRRQVVSLQEQLPESVLSYELRYLP
ncbi:hypothetical protein ACIBH1_17405 [Nonomuraea sp. NPDC050663]|uniref:hypothetical protein n=1 Tax=Nonomuraea sp. NPDC050663 TaxID=3364370 RepID=UPI00379AA58A